MSSDASMNTDDASTSTATATATSTSAHPERFDTLRSLLRRASAFAEDFQPDSDTRHDAWSMLDKPVLVVGAGGLGCEILKNCALSGFRRVHVIDMDTIDATNLNRQFLFTKADVHSRVGKAEAAAAAVMRRVAGVSVTPHFCRIEEKDDAFYRQFVLVLCGLDSVDARRWINRKLVSLIEYDDAGNPIDGIIPMVDGGSESWKGHAKLIVPGLQSCFECALPLFPPPVKVQFCTLANHPRQPEHCIEYIVLAEGGLSYWDKHNPFGGATTRYDTDNPDHMQWIFEHAARRADEFGIAGVTLKKTQGVVRNIIAGIAATNATVAAAITNEAWKFLTGCAPQLDNFMMYNGSAGIYSYSFQIERNPRCLACGQPRAVARCAPSTTLDELIAEHVVAPAGLNLKRPSLRVEGGKTLFMQAPAALRDATTPNLAKSLEALDVAHGDVVLVQSPTLPQSTVLLTINFPDADATTTTATTTTTTATTTTAADADKMN